MTELFLNDLIREAARPRPRRRWIHDYWWTPASGLAVGFGAGHYLTGADPGKGVVFVLAGVALAAIFHRPK